jgi:putative membrane protein
VARIQKTGSGEEMSRLRCAVTEAKEITSARVMPVLAKASSRYDRAEDLVGLWGAALGLALVALILSILPREASETPTGHIERLGLLPVLGVVAGGFVFGGLLATRAQSLARLFVRREGLVAAAERRASQIYSEAASRTQPSPSEPLVVLYVSLYERFTMVLIDETVRLELGASEIESIREVLRSVPRSADPSRKLSEAVRYVAERLATHYPPSADNRIPETPSPVMNLV